MGTSKCDYEMRELGAVSAGNRVTRHDVNKLCVQKSGSDSYREIYFGGKRRWKCECGNDDGETVSD